MIKIDSFEGGALPSKAQIRSIRISRDQFAAEHHAAGGINIEIITQPGLGPIRMNTGFAWSGDNLTGRSPFTPERGPEQNRNVFVGGGGTLIKNKARSTCSSTASIPRKHRTSTSSPAPAASLHGDALRTPRDNYNINANIDYALTVDQTLRFGRLQPVGRPNLGIGQWDEAERAYTRDSTNGFVRVQHIGPLGRRAFLRTRLQLAWTDTDSGPPLEALTIRVHDAFTSGGAQVAGGQHARTIVLGIDLDYVRGNHTLRTGVQVDASRWRSDDQSNYLGTYTFESLEGVQAGPAAQLHPAHRRSEHAVREVPGLALRAGRHPRAPEPDLSAGMRYEAQTHVEDYDNVMPRFGVTWAPSPAARPRCAPAGASSTTGSRTTPTNRPCGSMASGSRKSTLSIRRIRRWTSALLAAPVNRYLLGEDVALPRSTRVSLGIDQRSGRAGQRSPIRTPVAARLARGINLNAPINGVRPDPHFGNVIEVVSDASSRLHQLQTNMTVNPGALFPLRKSAPRFNQKRVTLFFNHTLGSLRNNTDGAFSMAPIGIKSRVGTGQQRRPPSSQHQPEQPDRQELHRRHQRQQQQRHAVHDAHGRDDNGDLVFNDRPNGSAGTRSAPTATSRST